MVSGDKIVLMSWEKFVTVVTFPFKMLFSLLNVLDTVQLAPGITIIDIMIFGVMLMLVALFVMKQAKGD